MDEVNHIYIKSQSGDECVIVLISDDSLFLLMVLQQCLPQIVSLSVIRNYYNLTQIHFSMEDE